MGTAIIQSHLGDGLYRIKIQFDNSKIEIKLARIASQLIELSAKIATAESELNDAQSELNTANEALNAYIAANDPEDIADNPAELNRLTAAAYQMLGDVNTKRSALRLLKLRKTALEKDQTYLQNNCPSEFEVDAWCVANNAVLTGTTATIEVDYALKRTGSVIENQTGVWLPATIEQTAPTSPDSILQHPMAGSPHSNWFNLSMIPAVQRDAMRYRIGTLSNLNKTANTCVVTLDGDASIYEYDSHLIPPSPIYPNMSPAPINATISYPPCNANAFENGDRVIVNPGNIVIGFVSNPRECPSVINWPSFYAMCSIEYQIVDGEWWSDYHHTELGQKSLAFRFVLDEEPISEGFVYSGFSIGTPVTPWLPFPEGANAFIINEMDPYVLGSRIILGYIHDSLFPYYDSPGSESYNKLQLHFNSFKNFILDYLGDPELYDGLPMVSGGSIYAWGDLSSEAQAVYEENKYIDPDGNSYSSGTCTHIETGTIKNYTNRTVRNYRTSSFVAPSGFRVSIEQAL